MSSTQEGSSDVGRGTASRGSRRIWTTREEVVLLAALKELVAMGLKSDNGFKPRYLPRLEKAIVKEFPGTDLKGIPHINSKLQTWKKNYGTLCTMLSRSGVGFNAYHMIECDDEQWEQFIKQDPNAKSMRNKAWPMFDAWQEIFGKDRATGNTAEDIMDAVNAMMQAENGVESEIPFVNLEPDQHEFFGNDMGDNSACSKEARPALNKKDKGKKRKSSDSGDVSVAEVLREITHGLDSRLDMIVNRMGHTFNSEQANDAFTLLGEIEGLTLDDKFHLCEIFSDKPQRLKLLEGLPPSTQQEYVQHLLKSKQQ